MSKARVVVRGNLSSEDAHRAMLSLLAMGLQAQALHPAAHGEPMTAASETSGLPSRSGNGPLGAWQISVCEDEVAAALPLLEEALAQPLARTAPASPFSEDGARIWTWTNSASGIAIALVCVGIHLFVHGGEDPTSRSAMIDAGAAAPWLVSQGQAWRLASAVFLHFDVKHLVGNMSALLFLGPPLAAQIGHLRTLVLFLATGVAGNVASHLLGNEAAVKAGASGGICGLLGALAGVALARMTAATDASARRPAWQTLGALAALFGMIVGFEPGRDHYAHVGGLLAGVVLGRLFGLGRHSGSTA